MVGSLSAMSPKPEYLHNNWANFKDCTVVQAYPMRCPYPDELIAWLNGLIKDESKVVLELGCSTGEIARKLAPDVQRMEAVDASQAMIDLGKSLTGGDHPNLHWYCGRAEEFSFSSFYSLIIAAGSLHWMEWETLFPLMHNSLSEQGYLAIILGGGGTPHVPWQNELKELIPKYSTTHNWESFDLLESLQTEGLLDVEETFTTEPIRFEQSIQHYVEHFHSMASFSRDRMDGVRAAEFDKEVERIVTPYATRDGMLYLDVVSTAAYGKPRSL